MKISRALILLILAAVTPLVIFTAVLGAISLRQQRQASEAEAIAKVDRVSALVDRELEAQVRALQAIAATPLLTTEPLDRNAITAYFAEVAKGQPSWRRLYLTGADGENIVTVPMLEDGTPGRIIERRSLAQVFATGRPQVGGVARRPGGRPAFPVRAPVVRDGEVVYVVSASVEPDVIARLLASADLPEGWLGGVVDRAGLFAARTQDHARRVGTPGSESLRAAVGRGGSGLYRGISLEKAPIVTAYRTLPGSGWSVHIALPQSLYTASFNRSAWLLAGGGLMVVLAAGLFLWILVRELEARGRREAALQEGQRLEALGRITGGVAHDFNNLLMIVQGSAEAIGRHIDSPERIRAYVDALQNAADRGRSLTRQLLAFGRRSAHEPASFRLQDRLGELRELLAKSTRSDITTSVFIPDDVHGVYADPQALEVALINLAVNARDAMTEGGHLALTAFNVHFEKRDTRTGLVGDYVAIVTADSGPGIPANVASRIFEPFYTTKPVGKGTGLGLSQVYGFAQQSGGAVIVDSTPGEGASFTLYLPRAREAPAARASEAPRIAGGADGDILVVEDNPDVSSLTQDMLHDAGYKVSWAPDGFAALRMLDEGARPHVILSDILMPRMTGLELARRVRSLHPGIAVVLMTGYSDALAEGVAAKEIVLQKPFGRDDALAAIDRARAAAGVTNGE